MEDCKGCKECKGYERQERRERPSRRSRGRGEDAGIERTSVPKIGVRDLRPTRATFLMLYGTPVTPVSKQLGQAKVATTPDMYSHTLPGFEHRAMERIGAALFG